jgi:uncharacterized protein YndB with AHSA1/START domain
MKQFKATATIARPPAAVWAYAADISRHADWMSVTDARAVQGDGSEVGSRGRARMVFGPFTWDTEFIVAEAEPGRRILWRSVDPRADMDFALELAADDRGATRATYSNAIQLRGRWRLLRPLLALEGAEALERELGRLKARVESAAAVGIEAPS